MKPVEALYQRRALGHQLEGRRHALLRVAMSWCHSRALADDLVQEAFAKALRNHSQLRQPEAFNAWLFHILYHCWIDHRRRERPCEDIETLADTAAFSTEQPQESREVIQQVRAAIARLPEGQREVLSLVDLAGFSYAEVAMILAIPTGTVTSRISRARETLRETLAALSIQPGKVVPIRLASA
jgi:RNA polymerase sigma-70 factor (ECF subfamily)